MITNSKLDVSEIMRQGVPNVRLVTPKPTEKAIRLTQEANARIRDSKYSEAEMWKKAQGYIVN